MVNLLLDFGADISFKVKGNDAVEVAVRNDKIRVL